MGEEVWMQALSQGRLDWFPELVEAYGSRIYALSARSLGGSADAEDLAQEIFLMLYRKLPQFRGEAALSTWVYRVAVNCAHSYRRKHTPLARWLLGEDAIISSKPAPLPPNDARLLEDERNKELYSALNRLSNRDREVIELFYFQELTCARIAEILIIAPRSAETRLYRARERLRRLMGGGREGEEREAEPVGRLEKAAGKLL